MRDLDDIFSTVFLCAMYESHSFRDINVEYVIL